MKFGKQIQSQQFTEWSPYYLDYKGLKKFISSLLNTPADSLKALGLPPIDLEDDRAKLLQSQKAAFFFKLERELEKQINSFYLQKENELKVRLRSLIDKKKVLQSDLRRLKHASTLFKAIQEAFVQFEQELTKIQKYVELNNEGFRKILKKWDKRSKSSTKELYLSRQIDIQPCFNTQVLCELSDTASANRIELSNIQAGIPISPANNTTETTSFVNDEIDDIEIDLVKAVTAGQPSLIKEILDRMMQNPSAEDHARLTRVFWHACSEAPRTVIDMLIDTQLVNFQYVDDIIERSCLHVAAMNGRMDVMDICTQHGANVELTDAYGRTALHYATMNGFSDCVSFLLTCQVDIERRDHDGFSPLIYAIMNGHTNCVDILLQANANIEPRHEGDHIPLSLACHFGQTDIALMLYNRGAKNLPNAESLYPLHLVARQGHAELCRVLSQNSHDIDTPDKYSTWTPLFWAANDGHVECVRILINAGCKVNAKDENGKTALYYAAWEGHMDCVQLLLDAGCEVEPVTDIRQPPIDPVQPALPEEKTREDKREQQEDAMDLENELDVIPSLSLPPPIIPFRIYGHNYLDRKHQIQISLRQPPIRLYDNAQISSMRLIISSKPDTGMIPHSVILPLVDDRDVFNFQVDKLDDFLLEFDILATFGSKVLGRGVALPQSFSRMDFRIPEGHCTIPLLDSHLKVMGELSYDYSVINPFRGVQLEIGGRIETYWKSTNTVLPATTTTSTVTTGQQATCQSTALPSAPSSSCSAQHESTSLNGNTNVNSLSSTVPSFITASSLSGDYVRVVIQLTKDLVPVVFANWLVPFQGLDLAVSDLTLRQFLSIGESLLGSNPSNASADDICLTTGNSLMIQKLSDYTSFLSLEQVLECIYDHVRSLPPDTASRSLFFSSYNPAICMVVNWKQPNYAVFFSTHCGINMYRGAKRRKQLEENDQKIVYKNDDVRCSSLKEAVKFAKQNNLLGVICGAQTLVQVPSLIKTAKESGLILVTSGEANSDPRYRSIQECYGVDAMMINQLVHFNTSMAGAGF
ncbi:Ankyrin repeat protein nuc-2 [Choanephora cucurbitarum]|uniref:Ankyrin repeat protein nuc-2 n=1 Tax=Choanephora cucurbitarum TaxID=101091 RepID=A0A1C7NCS9_9FUNG|nr:Ankyrin repeat protein nuc-2 [Choanephora cucurbitarum]